MVMNAKLKPENSPMFRPGGTERLSRRSLLKLAGGGVLALGASAGGEAKQEAGADYYQANMRINQSVIYWCFKPMPVEERAQAARMGLKSLSW